MIIYHATAVIGFRNKIIDTWNLYPYDKQSASCYNHKVNATKVLGQYYFNRMKKSSEYVARANLNREFGGDVRYDLDEGRRKYGLSVSKDFVHKNFGYNLQDIDFWDKSLIWQKGASIEGYYNFQILGNKPIEPPKIDYPKYIIELYTKQDN